MTPEFKRVIYRSVWGGCWCAVGILIGKEQYLAAGFVWGVFFLGSLFTGKEWL